jgi:hypothetical protein
MGHALTPWSAVARVQEAAIASLRDETVRLQKQIDEKAAAQAALQKDLERVKEAGLGEWLESVGVPFDAIEVTLTGLGVARPLDLLELDAEDVELCFQALKKVQQKKFDKALVSIGGVSVLENGQRRGGGRAYSKRSPSKPQLGGGRGGSALSRVGDAGAGAGRKLGGPPPPKSRGRSHATPFTNAMDEGGAVPGFSGQAEAVRQRAAMRAKVEERKRRVEEQRAKERAKREVHSYGNKPPPSDLTGRSSTCQDADGARRERAGSATEGGGDQGDAGARQG